MIRRLARWFLVALAVFSIAMPTETLQATSSGLSIGPFLKEVVISGEEPESSFLITIGNSTVATLPILINVVDFGAADENGGVNFLPNTDGLERKYGLASWMRPEKSSIVLQPKSSQQIKVTITNSESLSPGGHYGAVIFKLDKSQEFKNQSKVDFTKAVSTLVLAKKEGGARESVSVSGVTWNNAPFSLPDNVQVKLNNDGNVHARPSGDITVYGTLGTIVSKERFNQESTIILPETIRTYPTKINTTPIQWVPGWATITFRYRTNEADKYQVTTTRIFIFSPYTVVALIVLITLAVLGVRYRKELMHAYRHVRSGMRQHTSKR